VLYPTKTCYLQIDGKRNKKNQQDDQIQIQMSGEVLLRVKTIKYLGCHINITLKIDEHLVERTIQTIGAANDLYESDQFEKQSISSKVKIDQYKVYLRPILLFGLEVFENSKEIENHIRTTEMRKQTLILADYELKYTNDFYESIEAYLD